MPGGLLFVSQSLLDSWVDQGRIDLSGDAMALRGGEREGRRYALEPAVRILRVAGGGPDPHQLVARVKTLDQLRELGAEVMADSVVLGEAAYEAEPGFLAEPGAVQAAVTAPRPAVPVPRGVPPQAPGATSPRGELEERRRREAEALARFLLDNLP
jgi:hypothetical protein